MRTILFVMLVAITGGCSGNQEAAPEPTPAPPTPEGTAQGTAQGTPTPTEEQAPPREPGPEPRQPATGRSIVRTVQPFAAEGTLPDAAGLVETAMQRAATCYARGPAHQGVMEVRMAIGAEGTITEVTTPRDELGDETVTACIREAITPLRTRPPTALPATVTATWRFEVIHDVDVDRDCNADAECGLVTGLCEGPIAVAIASADRVDQEQRARAATVRCAETRAVPVLARCREGYCTAVPADLAEMRACTAAADCAVIERGCEHDAVAAARRADAEAAVAPERQGLVCDPATGAAPTAACVAGFCTLDWAASAQP